MKRSEIEDILEGKIIESVDIDYTYISLCFSDGSSVFISVDHIKMDYPELEVKYHDNQ